MKRLYFFGCLYLLLACENEPDKIIYPEYITAGQTQGIEIVYTDIRPNDTITLDFSSAPVGEENIDLDIDGTIDLKIYLYASSSPVFSYVKHTIIPCNKNAVATSETNSFNIDTLRLNDTIGPGLYWVNDTSLLYESAWVITGTSYRNGLWKDAGEKFVGVKLVKDDAMQYGWIRLKVEYIKLIIYDYACSKGY